MKTMVFEEKILIHEKSWLYFFLEHMKIIQILQEYLFRKMKEHFFFELRLNLKKGGTDEVIASLVMCSEGLCGDAEIRDEDKEIHRCLRRRSSTLQGATL